ncbi:MAG: Omp28-related outer membrane protein, partial [Bacteroidota bacterium]
MIALFGVLFLGLGFLLSRVIKSRSPVTEPPLHSPPLGPQETGDRKVLIEEFTGVQCVNCPQGSAEIENLIGLYGDQLIAVSIHSGFFADPFDESRFDFRIEAGEQLEGFLGEPIGYPSAVVNRRTVPNKNSLQAGQALWAGLVANAADEEPLLSLNAEVEYDGSNRELKVVITMLPTATLGEATKLTVMLTENNVSDFQLTPAGKQSDYKHKHVLRDVLTRFDGNSLGDLQKGVLAEQRFEYQISEAWNVQQCEIVAFVSKVGSDKEVLQVVAVKVED